ncbi:hypothetical protein, partial [uncultured Alistipes sp.]|uniref:hypothetical protein n=1 Tax=uncultured Alistipes sp. TaxID=538949 RepID=UPI00262FCF40
RLAESCGPQPPPAKARNSDEFPALRWLRAAKTQTRKSRLIAGRRLLPEKPSIFNFPLSTFNSQRSLLLPPTFRTFAS